MIQVFGKMCMFQRETYLFLLNRTLSYMDNFTQKLYSWVLGLCFLNFYFHINRFDYSSHLHGKQSLFLLSS